MERSDNSKQLFTTNQIQIMVVWTTERASEIDDKSSQSVQILK